MLMPHVMGFAVLSPSYKARPAESVRRKLADAAGDGSDPSGRGQPDRQHRYDAARRRNPECGRIAADPIVQYAGDPRTGRAAEDRRQHDRAEDAAVMPALEDLGRDRAHDRSQAVAE